MLSAIVTVAVPVATLLWLSVTVSVTVLAPASLQLKLVLLTLRDLIPQGSLEPSFTCAAVSVALPVASSGMVMFFVLTNGSILSATVIENEQDCVVMSV